jgi:crotonobetainyl-CoA:carnitine CoA-transferase CaiB-like acyl-CoA transferase
MRNRERLRILVNEKIGREPVAHWIEQLNKAGVPCGKVNTLADVFDDPQVRAQEMMLEIEHSGAGNVRMTGFPVKLSATPAQLRLPSPRLGEHNEEILSQLGYSTEQIIGLQKSRIV